MPSYWAYSCNERASLPLPGRPSVAGPRWRPLEWSNGQRQPEDLDAYLRQFETRPPADPMPSPRRGRPHATQRP
jgi:hypothetical protein